MNRAIFPNLSSLLTNDIYLILTKFTDAVTLNLHVKDSSVVFFPVPIWLSVLLVVVCHKQNTCQDFRSTNVRGFFFFFLKVLFSVQLFFNFMALTLPKPFSNYLIAFPETL